MPHTAAQATSPPLPTRSFGRFALHRLVGKSDTTMTWLAVDARTGAESMLTMPRVPPVGRGALAAWQLAARRAARLDHPGIAPVAECGAHQNWPFLAVDRRHGITLDEWLAERPPPAGEDLALWLGSLLRALAFAHDAGIAHLDLQSHSVLIDERGAASVMALAVAPAEHDTAAGSAVARAGKVPPGQVNTAELRNQRIEAERNMLAYGLLLHRLLASAPALDQADLGRAMLRMAPHGRELVRLPWTTPLPVPEALRAIVDRSTSSRTRLRYRSARTFLGALDGWREAVADDEGGPVALLLDRLRTVGHLPALPGLAMRVQRVTQIESQRTDEIARHLLPDMALTF